MATLFTRIIKGEIPCHKLAEDGRFLAFLDIRPIRPGHALVVPKVEVDYLFDLDDAYLGEMLRFAKPVVRAIETCVSCKRVGLIALGLEIPHAHIHLVPINSERDLDFKRAQPAADSQLSELATRIRSTYETADD